MRHFVLILMMLPLIIVARVATATQISSTFDTNADGWTASPGGTMTFVTTGGNPGGFLRDVDNDNTDMFVSAPAKFLGNQSAFIGGTIAFDSIELDTGPADYLPFGTIILHSGATAVQADIAPINSPTANWSTFTGTLDANTFGAAPAIFASVMSNLTEVDVTLESRVGTVETVGFDNFRITTAVPEPACAIGVAILMLASQRRRCLTPSPSGRGPG
jgi:hypothetical protein